MGYEANCNVSVSSDIVVGNSRAAMIMHEVMGADYEGVGAAGVLVRIKDNSTSPEVMIDSIDLSLTEDVEGKYGVWLNVPPTDGLVTVTVTAREGAEEVEFRLVGSPLVFDADNYNTRQVVSVTAIGDKQYSIVPRQAMLDHRVEARFGSNYYLAEAASVQVTVENNSTNEPKPNRILLSTNIVGPVDEGTGGLAGGINLVMTATFPDGISLDQDTMVTFGFLQDDTDAEGIGALGVLNPDGLRAATSPGDFVLPEDTGSSLRLFRQVICPYGERKYS